MGDFPMNNDHPWGGTVLQSEVTESVYPEVIEKRIGDLYLDVGNVAAVHLLGIVSERVNESADNIRSTEFSTLITEDEDLIFDYYLSNTLSLSYFEAAMFLIFTEPLCYKNSELGKDILRYFDKELERYSVVREGDESDKRQAIVEILGENYSTGDYLRLIEDELDTDRYLDISDDLLSEARAVRDDRGSLVHNFTYLFQASGSEAVKEQARHCQSLVNETHDLLRQELLINQDLLQMVEN